MLMPYLQIFTVGEVLRRGVTGPPEKGFAIKAGLVVYSLTQYAVFAPLYWFWMARKARGETDRRATGNPPGRRFERHRREFPLNGLVVQCAG